MRQAVMTTLFISMFVLVIGASVYIPFRLGRLFQLQSAKALYAIFIFGLISFFLSAVLQSRMPNGFVNIYYILSMQWFGFFIYLIFIILGFEIINVFIKLQPKISAVTVIAIALVFAVYSTWSAYRIKNVSVDIPIKGIVDEVKIVHLSDIHLGVFRNHKYLKRLVEETNKLNPHIVLLNGDLFDGRNALRNSILSPLRDFKAPVYFTTGNHDSYAGIEEAMETLKKNGVKILRNSYITLEGVQFIGLDYMKADPDTFDMHVVNKYTIKDILPKIKMLPGVPKVLVHHSPVGVKYMKERGINLMISGHTHGGQMFPGMLIARVFFPYLKGLYNYNGTHVYVSQGAGTFGPAMRFGTNNEISFIRLKKK
ncbi:metallophosphoesterase [Spirochaetota bacterium]